MGSPNILDVDIVDRDTASTRLRLGTREVTLPSAVPADVQTGAIAIRPEKVRLDVPNGWTGRIVGQVYKGVTMSYQVQLEDGVEINADVAHDDVAHRHHVGDQISVSFRQDDIVFIPDRA
jgi:ABC-type Fe3+/spermidine/putrescine transport system ATPase subunit